ncbi:unnamed protein product [Phytophthora fragariaefolia]|uniref:Unnamed protein product n=1 Tax=Phytophthora fragariaefolia TaxID=1490495 RepID=A0A9W6TYD6_9STRA|nr:unnamed protein product [Phytophthora fragariaefolia]
MPSPIKLTNKQRQHERVAAKARVVRAYKNGEDWREVAAHNDVPYRTARRAVLSADGDPKRHGGVREPRVKMTVEVMASWRSTSTRTAATRANRCVTGCAAT